MPTSAAIVRTALGAVAVAATVSILLSSRAEAMPQQLAIFFGQVTVGGQPAPTGLEIEARIGGVNFAFTPSGDTVPRTAPEGTYGVQESFQVLADDPDTPGKEGGVDGDTIQFIVGGSSVVAGTALFQSGAFKELGLALLSVATPAPTPDERFGVFVHPDLDGGIEYLLDRLGVRWYLHRGADMTDVPAGYQKLRYISPIQPGNLLSPQRIAELVQGAPSGSHWYVGGEPNRKGISGSQFADVFNHYYTNIKAVDPTAKITGPSILNWDFICVGCAGYTSGESWLQEFIAAYQASYGQGEPPPVDAWAIDVYPIDWINTPNNSPDNPAYYEAKDDFFMHWEIAVQQLEGLRQYLDTFPQYVDTPIWITEIALHVGYDGIDWGALPQIVPVGAYHWDLMSDFINSVLDWLDVNAASHRVERWFFHITWADIVNVDPGTGYMGIIFFDGPQQGASLNCLGEVYRSRASAESRRCDAGGSPIPPVGPTPTPAPTPPQVPSAAPWTLAAVGGALALLIAAYARRSQATSGRAVDSGVD